MLYKSRFAEQFKYIASDNNKQPRKEEMVQKKNHLAQFAIYNECKNQYR